MIAGGRSPVIEPGLDQLVADTASRGTLRTTTNAHEAVDGAEVSLVCVGTPSAPNGSTDLLYVQTGGRGDRQGARSAEAPTAEFHSVVVRSTVPPGTVDELVTPILEEALGEPGSSFGTAMCPEFLREGSGVADFFAPPFTVVGTQARQGGRRHDRAARVLGRAGEGRRH